MHRTYRAVANIIGCGAITIGLLACGAKREEKATSHASSDVATSPAPVPESDYYDAPVAADTIGDSATDTRVDLIEDVKPRRPRFSQRSFECQQCARELAARGDLAQRPGVDAFVWGDQELDAIDAVAAEASAIDDELGAFA